MKFPLLSAALILALAGHHSARDLTPAEQELRTMVGGDEPMPMLLWDGPPPRFVANAAPEKVSPPGTVSGVSVPTISAYLPEKEKSTGMAIVVCAGGGYGSVAWLTHVVYAARVFVPKGVAVIGLKYRTRPPNGTSNEEIQAVSLLDAQRAIRTARHRAAEWNLDPRQIGIAGYSAGANLAVNLAANFTDGDPSAPDPIDRLSSRPDFAIGLATWHWRKKESPFTFRPTTPPVYLVHATNDGIGGGAPIELPREIKGQLAALGVPVHLEIFDEGGHGVGNLIPQRVKNGFPPATWPDRFLRWHASLASRPK